jgi:hypothetical protein
MTRKLLMTVAIVADRARPLDRHWYCPPVALAEVLAVAVSTAAGMAAGFTAGMVASFRAIMDMAIPHTLTTVTDRAQVAAKANHEEPC